jgi:hypothetical protein
LIAAIAADSPTNETRPQAGRVTPLPWNRLMAAMSLCPAGAPETLLREAEDGAHTIGLDESRQ